MEPANCGTNVVVGIILLLVKQIWISAFLVLMSY